MKHRDCQHVCQIYEHKGYTTCALSGACELNNPAPRASEIVRSPPLSRRTEPEEGRGAALLLMLAITLACVVCGD